MPNEGSGTKSDFFSRLLEPPAKIHVVPRRMKDRIEPAHFLERPFVKYHIATRDVLGLAIAEQHWRRAAWRCHHRRRHRRILGGKQIGPADPRKLAAQ